MRKWMNEIVYLIKERRLDEEEIIVFKNGKLNHIVNKFKQC